MLGELLRRRFGLDWSHDETFVKKPILFGDYMRMGATGDDRLYEEVSLERLPKLLTAYQVGGWVTAVGPDPPARSASAPRRSPACASRPAGAPGATFNGHPVGVQHAARVEALGSGACRRRSSTGRRASR
jgi:hypothetical protein